MNNFKTVQVMTSNPTDFPKIYLRQHWGYHNNRGLTAMHVFQNLHFFFIKADLFKFLPTAIIIFHLIYHDFTKLGFSVASLRKDSQLADAGFNFKQCSFSWKSITFIFILFSEHRSNFLSRLPRFVWVLIKVEYI